MAFVPMTAGGGSMSETTLWTNATPTADFAAATVNLSDNISNYDYIVIEANFSKSENNSLTYIYKASELPNCTQGGTYPVMCVANYYNSRYYYRLIYYVSDTSVSVGTCKYNTGNGTAANYNSGCIPLTIKGMKYA